jgi:hypothetical protein
MEGREAGSFSKHRRILSSLEWNFDGEAELDFSEREAYDGTNGRRFQYWSPGEVNYGFQLALFIDFFPIKLLLQS